VNFVFYFCRPDRNVGSIFCFVFLALVLLVSGCNEPFEPPSPEKLSEFQSAGPIRPEVDLDRLMSAKITKGPYKIIKDDLLQLTMPSVLQVITAQTPGSTEQVTPMLCRVSETGEITLPIAGQIRVEGKTLAQIEAMVVDAYFPKYTLMRPVVVAQVQEYKTFKVSITGAVEQPGVYSLRSDQMSLVSLLMEAGGIIDDGAAIIRIVQFKDLPKTYTANQSSRSKDVVLTLSVYSDENLSGLLDDTIRSLDQNQQVPLQMQSKAESMIQSTNDLQLEFKPASDGKKGRLVVTKDARVLLTEKMDITSDIQRLAVLEKIEAVYPNVSLAVLEKRLCDLSEIIEPGSVGTKESSFEITGTQFTQSAVTNQFQNPSPDSQKQEQIILPVKGLNIPFKDVELKEGDSVVVEGIDPEIFTVIGLVRRPGNFPYPLNVEYNLMQAIAFAEGFNQKADPQYTTIYRQRKDGSIVNLTFQVVDGSRLTGYANVSIKPGDIVAVDRTLETRRNVILSNVFRFNIGAYLPLQ